MLKQINCEAWVDSIYFYRGYAYYQLKQLDSATYNFIKVRNPDSLANKAKFFAIVAAIYNDKPKLCDSISRTVKHTSQIISDLKKVCDLGIALYQSDMEKYRTLSDQISLSSYLLSNEIQGLSRTYETLLNKRKKSPTKAAIFSAIIPGSGKWYLGRKGQAIASFLTVGILGGISAELIAKNGWYNFFSISAITTTAIFYGGNIYGSYYLGKYVNRRLDEKIKQDVQYYIHVAVRNVYYY
ncbi:MAG: hypothetical protein N2662_09415 [Bacteroidales bacterium]|nr:hypothetical protein [Bacteroidales bacterium]